MDFDGVVQIFILSFSWQPNKDWKELRNDFAWVWGWGLWNLWFFFFNGVFMLNFLGLWIWFLGLWILFAGGFCGWLKDEKIWVWVVILYIWVLWFEKSWEDLLLGLCLCSCWRSISVCVWLTRKGKKMQENMSMCSYV